MSKLDYDHKMFGIINHTISTHQAASAAQYEFDKWLSEQPVVFGHVKEGTPNFWGPKNSKFDDNHTARIIDIQPIEKPKVMSLSEANQLSVKICGLDLEQIEKLIAFYMRETGNRPEVSL